MTETELRILRLLKVGQENARPVSEMVSLTKINERTIREIIARLVTQYGIAIGGHRDMLTGGVFLIADEAELVRVVNVLDKQVDKEQQRIRALLQADLKEYQKYV